MITQRTFRRAAGMNAAAFTTTRSLSAWAQGASTATKGGEVTPAEAGAIAKEA